MKKISSKLKNSTSMLLINISLISIVLNGCKDEDIIPSSYKLARSWSYDYERRFEDGLTLRDTLITSYEYNGEGEYIGGSITDAGHDFDIHVRENFSLTPKDALGKRSLIRAYCCNDFDTIAYYYYGDDEILDSLETNDYFGIQRNEKLIFEYAYIEFLFQPVKIHEKIIGNINIDKTHSINYLDDKLRIETYSNLINQSLGYTEYIKGNGKNPFSKDFALITLWNWFGNNYNPTPRYSIHSKSNWGVYLMETDYKQINVVETLAGSSISKYVDTEYNQFGYPIWKVDNNNLDTLYFDYKFLF